MAEDERVENVIQGLRALQATPLSIIRLSEPICAAQTESNRNSDVSSSAFESPSPESLEADLTHYKELFSKLRFSYLEQVTKEKFLRAIVGSPPQIVETAENTLLESHLATIKPVLCAQKEAVANIISELDERGRDLSRRHETIELQTTLLSTLPEQISNLNAALEQLRKQNRTASGGPGEEDERPEMNLGLLATREVIEERRARGVELEGRLRALRQGLPRQSRMLEQEERELGRLEGEREGVVREAREAVERRREGGALDEMEIRGRWLTGVKTGLDAMLPVGS